MSLLTSLRDRSRVSRCDGDRGAAVLTVLLLLVALTAVTTTAAVVAKNDVVGAGRDRQSLGALASADAGVAQALEYIRTKGVGELTCMVGSAPSACSAKPIWANPVTPATFQVGGGTTCSALATCYRVWIETLVAYNPPAVKTGKYRIHSTGITGGGPGTKRIVVDTDVTPSSYPIGVYGDELIGNGNNRVVSEMLFTQACVSPRETGGGNGIRFTGTDPYWGEPASANSTTNVSTGNNCDSSGFLHKNSADCPNNVAMNFDRSSLGGPLPVGSPCRFTYTGPDGVTKERTSTLFNLQILQDEYGFTAGGLTDDQYEALRQRSQGQNLYNAPVAQLSTRLDAAVTSGINNPVVYYDNLSDVPLKDTDFPAAHFGRAPGSACVAKSVVVVVRNGNLLYQGGNATTRSLALFVPEGDYRGNGGYAIIGTLFARELNLGGTEEFHLDDCFIDNLPGPLLELEVTSFREDDRSDVG